MSESKPEPLDAWKDIDYCEGCEADDTPLRAIKMRKGRRQMLCQDCFEDAIDEGEVSLSDERIVTAANDTLDEVLCDE